MTFIIFFFFFLKKLKKVEKIGYHSNFNFECNTERGSIESLSIALGNHPISGTGGQKVREKRDIICGWTFCPSSPLFKKVMKFLIGSLLP